MYGNPFGGSPFGGSSESPFDMPGSFGGGRSPRAGMPRGPRGRPFGGRGGSPFGMGGGLGGRSPFDMSGGLPGMHGGSPFEMGGGRPPRGMGPRGRPFGGSGGGGFGGGMHGGCPFGLMPGLGSPLRPDYSMVDNFDDDSDLDSDSEAGDYGYPPMFGDGGGRFGPPGGMRGRHRGGGLFGGRR